MAGGRGVLALFAGHGFITESGQTIVLNEFIKRTGYYSLAPVERITRDIAEKFKNSYSIAIFACCRQNYSPATVKDLNSMSKEEAHKPPFIEYYKGAPEEVKGGPIAPNVGPPEETKNSAAHL